MINPKYYFYEIFSISSGLALLAFFGTFSFFPMEIMLMGENQSWYWVFLLVCFGAFSSLILVSFLKGRYSSLILRISDILLAVVGIIVLNVYLTFTKDLLEPWYIQAAWFFRYNGFIIGIFCSLLFLKSVSGISFLISKQTELTEIKSEASSKNEPTSKMLSFLIILISFSFYGLEIILFRYFTLLSSFVLIIFVQLIQILLSIFLFSSSKYDSYLAIQIKGSKMEKSPTLKKTEKEGRRKESTFIQKMDNALRSEGTSYKFFQWAFIPLLITITLAILTISLMPFNIVLWLSMPFSENTSSSPIPLVQILSIITIVILAFSLIFIASGGSSRLRFTNSLKDGKLFKSKISIIGFLDGMRYLGLIFSFSLLVYFFIYPIYFPNMILFIILYAILGAVLYYIFGNGNISKTILYSISIFLLVLSVILLFIDGFENGLNYNSTISGSYDILFPFQFLHSTYHCLLVGIPLGIISTDLIVPILAGNTDGRDSTNKALFLTISFFIGGIMIIPFNWLLNNPGSAPPLEDQTSLNFRMFSYALILILLLGFSYYIITDRIIPNRLKKKTTKKIRQIPKKKEQVASSIDQNLFDPANRKKIFAILFTSFLLISIIGGIGSYNTYQQTYNKPLIAHSPGNYYLWYQPSSERVAKNIEIAVVNSEFLEAIEINLAKNEYEAFQIVWRPLSEKIEDLSFQISDFIMEDDSKIKIDSSVATLRYVENIIEGEFPDILKPFTIIDLDEGFNSVFWFSLKTPYNIPSGSYAGNLTFLFNDVEKVEILIRLNIWDFAIPNERHLSTNIQSATDNQDILDNYFYHRMNNYGVSIRAASSLNQLKSEAGYTCYLDQETGEWTFNWTWWDSNTEYKLNNGMNAFRVNYPLGIGGGPAGGRDPYIEEENKMNWLKSWLTAAQDHLEEKGWLNYSYYYFIDEFQMFIPSGYTRAEYFNRLLTLLQAMKESAPKIKIMCTAPPTKELELLRDYFDIYCPVSFDRDKERWDERLDAGCEFWMYACVGPMAPYPNSHLYNRLYETRILMWQCYLYGLHGFLYWHSMYYGHGKYGVSYNGYGDGWFIYSRNGQLYDTLKWENYLDGQEDYEYLWLVNAALEYLSQHLGDLTLEQIIDYQNEVEEILKSIVGERHVYCDHPSTLYGGREQIGNLLNLLADHVNLQMIGEKPWNPPYRPDSY